MALPVVYGQVWPNGGVTDPSLYMDGIRAFVPRTELSSLQLPTMQQYHRLNTAGTSTPDDASAVLASQVFGA